MTRSARIGLAAALLLGGATFAMGQNGPATGGYPPGTKNPNLYGYYGYYDYYGYYARPRYAPSYYGTPYYVLGYPVPHYGYMGWRKNWPPRVWGRRGATLREYSLNRFCENCATATAPLGASSRAPDQKVFQDELALAIGSNSIPTCARRCDFTRTRLA